MIFLDLVKKSIARIKFITKTKIVPIPNLTTLFRSRQVPASNSFSLLRYRHFFISAIFFFLLPFLMLDIFLTLLKKIFSMNHNIIQTNLMTLFKTRYVPASISASRVVYIHYFVTMISSFISIILKCFIDFLEKNILAYLLYFLRHLTIFEVALFI